MTLSQPLRTTKGLRFYRWLIGISLCFVFFGTLNTELQAQNNPPLIDTLTACTEPMTPVNICHNFIDPDGDNTMMVDGHTTFNCSLNFLSDTCVRYTPLPGFIGTDTIFLDICDDVEPPACSVSVVVVYIGCLPPQAQDDNVTISEASAVINGEAIEEETPEGAIVIDPTINDNGICSGLVIPFILDPPENGLAEVYDDTEISYQPYDGFFGYDTLRYITCNDCPLCDTATVVIQVVDPVAPCETDIFTCVGTFTSTNICPTFCELEVDDIVSIEASAVNGTIDPVVDGCAQYIPSPESTLGDDIVTFIATDIAGNEETVLAYLTIDVACGTNAPVATDDNANTAPASSVVIEVLLNDYDADGQPISVTEVTDPPNGTVVLDPITNSMIYTPTPGFVGIDAFTYTICDDTGLCDEATVTIQVQDDCLGNYEYCTEAFTPVIICVDFCDEAISEDGLAIVDAGTTFDCSLTVLNDTCLQYMPLPGFLGTDLVTMIGCDAAGVCDTAYATVNVGCFAPTANDDAAVIDLGEAADATLDVLANDVEQCGNDLSTVLTSTPANGIATLNENGILTYTPSLGFSGTESFTYQVCTACDETLCDEATVTIEVLGSENLAPIAMDDEFEVPIDGNLLGNIAFNDIDPNPDDELTITILEEPLGELTLNDNGSIGYFPPAGFIGTDTFDYIICDDGVPPLCDTATVTILVGEGLPPVAMPDTAFTQINTAVYIFIASNDVDIDTDLVDLTFTLLDPPAFGEVIIDGIQATYTPNPEYNGMDGFTYVVCDPLGLCDTTTVTIIIQEGPDAQPDIFYTNQDESVIIDPLSNDGGVDLTITEVGDPLNGTIIDNGDGTLTYTPNEGYLGPDYFSYIICDDNGNCSETFINVTVFSTGTNLPPTALNDIYYTNPGFPIDLMPMLNDSDPEGEELTITEMGDPSSGTLATIGDNITFVPEADFEGVVEILYTVCDPEAQCDEATIVIYIGTTGQVNQPPVAGNDSGVTNIDTPVVIDVLSNDGDPNTDDELSVTYTTIPANGTMFFSDGSYTYTPFPGFEGTDYVFYVLCDDGVPVLCDTAYVAITVLGDAPLSIEIETMEDTDIEFCLDEYLDVLPIEQIDTIIISSIPANGSPYFLDQDGCLAYSPDLNYNGGDFFVLQICNEAGECITVNVSVTVLPESDNPIAIDDSASGQVDEPITIDVVANDENPDGGDLLVVNITEPMNGTVLINEDGTLEYIPDAGFVGQDTFSYTITNSLGLVDAAMVIVTITEGPDYPDDMEIDAVYDSYFTDPDTPLNIEVLGNDIYPEEYAEDVVITFISDPEFGTLVYDTLENVYTYFPNGEQVTDVFDYTLCIGDQCDTAQVIVVSEIPDSEECEIIVPTGISPNGDGMNDYLIINGVECFNTVDMQVFNRWGDMVYTDNNYQNSNPWTGYYSRNYQFLPSGTYFYILILNEGLEDEEKHTGYIELRR